MSTEISAAPPHSPVGASARTPTRSPNLQDGHLDARLQRAGISLHLELTGTFPAYEQTPAFHRTRGRVQEDARRFYQNGIVTGWIEVDGERIEIDPDRWWFGRDHSWGCGTAAVAAASPKETIASPGDPGRRPYYMGIFQFDEELVHFAQRETSTGSAGSSRAKCSTR